MPNLAVAAAALADMAAIRAIKTLLQTVTTFQSELDSLVTRAYRGHIGAAALARQMKALLAEYIREAYIEGFAEAGLDESDLEAADERLIRDMAEAQAEYVDRFAQAVMDAKSDHDLRDAIDARVNYWGKSMAAAGLTALTSAKGKEIVEWQLGEAEEHCETCAKLDGARHTRQWFAQRGYNPATPGASMECQGFNCDCQLVSVAGIQRSIVSHVGN